MKLRLRALLVTLAAGTLALSVYLPLSAADTGNGARRRVTAPTAPKAPTAANFAKSEKEAYLTDDGIAYIRPGVKIKINSVTIGADRKPVVDFNLTDSFDQPLDRAGKVTPGAISASFIMAWYNPATRQYTSYTTRTQTTPASSPRPGVSAIQAGADSGGTFTDLEMGHYRYTFKTVLPANFDQTKTHTLGVYGNRNLSAIIDKVYLYDEELDFRPDGGTVTDKWDKINQAASCNNCHDPLTAHGETGRSDVKMCALCHTPQTVDPDTGRTVDLKVMIHKIHFGPNLPSVKAGTPYVIIGNAQGVNDYSHITYPQDIRNCDNCHEGTNPAAKPSQAMVYLTNPSRDACGSCHDDIDWTAATGAANAHPGGPQANDDSCTRCHLPASGTEFDASIAGAHTIPTKSTQLKGLTAKIISVTNLAPGKAPTVVFALTNKDGKVDGTKLDSFSPMFAGPTTSYTSPYFRESGIATGTNPGTYDAATGYTTFTFKSLVPTTAKGTWTVTLDAYKYYNLTRGDGKPDITRVRDAVYNPIKYVAITGTVTPRRTSVTMAQCNSCHDTLALHGGQRFTWEECVICHNPTQTDVSRRTAGDPAESVSFQRMIHRIHTGEELTQEYTVAGNNYNEVTFPGDRRNCTKCHTSTGYQLPLPTGIDSVITPRDYFSPQGPATAACLGCHDNRDAAAHAYLNTTTFGGTTPAEACATCHGNGKDWDVTKVHAR